MNELSPEGRNLIAMARPAEAPPAMAKDKVWDAVAVRITLAAGASAAAAGASKTAAASTSSTTISGVASHGGLSLLGIGIGAAVVTTAVAGICLLRSPEPSRVAATPVSVRTPAGPPVSPGPSAPSPTAQPKPEPLIGILGTSGTSAGAEHRPAARANHRTRSVPASEPVRASEPGREDTLAGGATRTDCSVNDELALLEAAQMALRQVDGRAALASLELHDLRCPHAKFREENRAARVLALCLLGRTEGAAAEAVRLADEAPRSPQLARLRASCAASALSVSGTGAGRSP